MKVISNSSPLINFAALGRFTLLRELYGAIVMESGQEWGLRSKLQLGLGFIRHTWVPVLKPSAQFLVEDLGPNL